MYLLLMIFQYMVVYPQWSCLEHDQVQLEEMSAVSYLSLLC